MGAVTTAKITLHGGHPGREVVIGWADITARSEPATTDGGVIVADVKVAVIEGQAFSARVVDRDGNLVVESRTGTAHKATWAREVIARYKQKGRK